jgi:hypothetical protein
MGLLTFDNIIYIHIIIQYIISMFHCGCPNNLHSGWPWPIRESSNAFIALVVNPQGRCGHKRFLQAQKATDFVEVSVNSNSLTSKVCQICGFSQWFEAVYIVYSPPFFVQSTQVPTDQHQESTHGLASLYSQGIVCKAFSLNQPLQVRSWTNPVSHICYKSMCKPNVCA